MEVILFYSFNASSRPAVEYVNSIKGELKQKGIDLKFCNVSIDLTADMLMKYISASNFYYSSGLEKNSMDYQNNKDRFADMMSEEMQEFIIDHPNILRLPCFTDLSYNVYGFDERKYGELVRIREDDPFIGNINDIDFDDDIDD